MPVVVIIIVAVAIAVTYINVVVVVIAIPSPLLCLFDCCVPAAAAVVIIVISLPPPLLCTNMPQLRDADTTSTWHLRSRHGLMLLTWSVSCWRHGADMSACRPFSGGEIPDTTPTFPAKLLSSSTIS